MRIVYLPIDERPCNTLVVNRIADSAQDVQLVMPPKEYLSDKKIPASTELLWDWLLEHMDKADACILSMDMLIYGGLIPSRLHGMADGLGEKWMERLRELHASFPSVPIYASNMIMRTPRYSSNDEEPDYYEDWGREIFLRAFLSDKKAKQDLTEEETKQLQDILDRLPQQFIQDYEARRQFNSYINQQVLELVKDGVIHFLVIPQDDSAEYGYTANDQYKVIRKRADLRLYDKVHIYPGADEVGATLLARVYNDYYHNQPSIYPIWSSTLGPVLIPMYEDRPFYESLKAHIIAAGCRLVDHADEADLILAYNTPGKVMQESWEQDTKDITYDSFRNLLEFTEAIQTFIKQGKSVIVADAAYANGGDHELVLRLDDQKLLDKLLSYKGWNTNGNTLGTTISQGVLGRKEPNELQIQANLIYHLLDDLFYQTQLRRKLTDEVLPTYGLTYFDLKDKEKEINQIRNEWLLDLFYQAIHHSFVSMSIQMHTYAPWNRMFECGIVLDVTDRNTTS